MPCQKALIQESEGLQMVAKKDIDWGSLGFGYIKTDKRFVSNYKNGAWDEGVLTDDANVVMNLSLIHI